MFPLIIGTGGQQITATVWLFCIKTFWGTISKITMGEVVGAPTQAGNHWRPGKPAAHSCAAIYTEGKTGSLAIWWQMLASWQFEVLYPCLLPWPGNGMDSAEAEAISKSRAVSLEEARPIHRCNAFTTSAQGSPRNNSFGFPLSFIHRIHKLTKISLQ